MEALQFTVPVVSFRGTSESGSNRELRIKRRGRSSLYLNDDPRVFIDQVRIADISVLEGMPAGDIAAIVVLSGLDGTTYYGTSAGNGVVLIFTHAKTPRSPKRAKNTHNEKGRSRPAPPLFLGWVNSPPGRYAAS